jgi:hypothetical protein
VDIFWIGVVLIFMGGYGNFQWTSLFGSGKVRRWIPINPIHLRISGLSLIVPHFINGNIFLYIGIGLAVIVLIAGLFSEIKRKDKRKDIDEV